MTDTFEALDDGRTRHTTRVLRPRSLKDRAFLSVGLSIFERVIRTDIRALLPLIAEDAAARAERGADLAEPDVPASAERFITEPIRMVDPAASHSS